MQRSAVLLTIFLLAPHIARAQKNEVFAGYSFQVMEARPSGFALINGWEATYTYKFSGYLGISADASGDYGTVTNSRMNFHSYLFGPQMEFPVVPKLMPFVHARLGWSRSSFQGLITRKPSFDLGGGTDYKASNNFSIRLIQADFITGNFTQSSPEIRFSTGMVFQF
ncbi:MAG TPA: hypothetical protein VGR72_13830 [Candidatus Acidoferrales bacterium]|nr:hypothetical protein [Candidatus Acidoferrales bacterium]